MHQNLFNHTDIDSENVNILSGTAEDSDAECRSYEERYRSGSVDLCILGVGLNGHIAFNEPGCSRDSKTRVVELTDNTKQANNIQ
mmetsp:Transcript_95507/g.206080  ORF Transcript_95507/g.206080 Transcript_95507/m.206080 type:complete len:85 (+) Transcript_95507:262-516(+)